MYTSPRSIPKHVCVLVLTLLPAIALITFSWFTANYEPNLLLSIAIKSIGFILFVLQVFLAFAYVSLFPLIADEALWWNLPRELAEMYVCFGCFCLIYIIARDNPFFELEEF